MAVQVGVADGIGVALGSGVAVGGAVTISTTGYDELWVGTGGGPTVGVGAGITTVAPGGATTGGAMTGWDGGPGGTPTTIGGVGVAAGAPGGGAPGTPVISTGGTVVTPGTGATPGGGSGPVGDGTPGIGGRPGVGVGKPGGTWVNAPGGTTGESDVEAGLGLAAATTAVPAPGVSAVTVSVTVPVTSAVADAVPVGRVKTVDRLVLGLVEIQPATMRAKAAISQGMTKGHRAPRAARQNKFLKTPTEPNLCRKTSPSWARTYLVASRPVNEQTPKLKIIIETNDRLQKLPIRRISPPQSAA